MLRFYRTATDRGTFSYIDLAYSELRFALGFGAHLKFQNAAKDGGGGEVRVSKLFPIRKNFVLSLDGEVLEIFRYTTNPMLFVRRPLRDIGRKKSIDIN